MLGELASYAKSCDPCLRMKKTAPYKTLLYSYYPQSGLSDILSIAVAGLLSVTIKENWYLLVFSEHLSGWFIAKAAKFVTTEVVISFIENERVYPFAAQKTVVSNTAICLSARLLRKIIKRRGTRWHTELLYAPMSNGRTERMVKTIKRAVG